MKALTIHQPFASQVVLGTKRIEYRTWPTQHRGPLAIHAAKTAARLPAGQAEAHPLGALVGLVQLTACTPPADDGDLWHWQLANPQALAVPIPCAGRQGLWTLPAELEHRLVAALQPGAKLPGQPSPEPTLFTSCFARLKAIPDGLTPVAISIGIPRWFTGRRDLRLAPTRAMLEMTATEYDKRFAAILARLDPAQVAADLGEGAVMLCWEGPGLRCHRRWVADWLEDALGIVVPELGFDRGDIPRFEELPAKK